VFDVIVYETLDSTNAYLKRSLKSDNASYEPYTVIWAKTQTAGYGQKDRVWVSPAGAGLYVSILLQPPNVYQQPLTQLPLVVGLSWAVYLNGLGYPVQLKWVNDLLMDRKKLGGILVESTGQGVVVGFGVNILSHPDTQVSDKIALEDKGVDRLELSQLLNGYLNVFEDYYHRWNLGDWEKLRGEWWSLSVHQDEAPVVLNQTEEITPLHLGKYGELIYWDKFNQEKSLISGNLRSTDSVALGHYF
jgi:BirA family transcriptional regulator, biotin operon repressor / biotin---[acetyl-CoA-carboxylase] ligase